MSLLIASVRSEAQETVLLGSWSEERLRLGQLIGETAPSGWMLRSASSLSRRRFNDTGATRALHWAVVTPEIVYSYNSTLPHSFNDGALWAGRGSNVSILWGVRAERGPLRVLLIPEYANAGNEPYPLTGPPHNPVPPMDRSPFSSPWHANGQSIDLPIRFGASRFERLSWGQTSVLLDVRGTTVGASTENEWWGPGIRNALVLSNNAEGFPHALVRPTHPVATRFGVWDARGLAGWLRESDFFDDDSRNDLRSIALLALTWSPRRDAGLSLGATRAVFAPAPSRSRALRDAFQVFADVGRPNAKPYTDSTIAPGRDQLISFFLRWAFPKDGFEAYGEWGRAEFPTSLRDFVLYPNHTQGYTLGLQWLGDTLVLSGRLHAQAEFTFLEQSTTYRFRDLGSWYTSRAVVQGYTNRGQSLGAAIGPGASSQWLGLDYVAPRWRLGGTFNRIRWDEDAHSQRPYESTWYASYGWCEHDVSMLSGARAGLRTRFGDVAAEYSSGWRLNVFFENEGPCPIKAGRDVRTNSLQIRFTPSF